MLANPYVAARNKVERTIAGIWQEMLGIERVGINDNFFELGGNSLMGIEVVSELSKAFDVEVSVVSLYEGPTVSSLSRLLTEAEGSGSSLDNRHSRGERRRAKIEQRIKAG
jgi:acyl carrier protein